MRPSRQPGAGARPAFIAGDWGTSHLRLSLCAEDGAALATVRGPGAGTLGGEGSDAFPRTLAGLIAPWSTPHRSSSHGDTLPDAGPLPVLLCGMVGSALGWHEVPYLSSPVAGGGVGVADVAAALWRVDGGQLAASLGADRPVFIVPGVTAANAWGGPDVMRGEETQILGALALAPDLGQGRHLLCLPGTHAKWAVLDDGRLTGFTTAPTGELYALLAEHATIARGCPPWDGSLADPAHDDAFRRGARLTGRAGASLLHHLFEARSRRMVGALPAGEGLPFLSGLLIGADVAALAPAALAPDGGAARPPLTLIGGGGLTALYQAALLALGHPSARILDGDHLSLLGLAACYRHARDKGLLWPADHPTRPHS